jgi:DNA polymerase III sliding clamp (beta) subunit (PCNA family)
MIFKTKEFKQTCSSILSAIDSNELSTLTETLELVSEGKTLYLNVTNKEYYVSRKFELDQEEVFHATVKAETFLKLIDRTTTEEVELTLQDNYVLVKANGNYKLPLVFENDNLLELPIITIDNKTVDMEIPYSVLESIATYNSKEIAQSSLAQPVQKLYYVDEHGCITFTKGSCVNSFTLDKPIRILLNDRLVKLFKLFKTSSSVKFELGYDAISETIIQTKVSFSNENIKLTAILSCNNDLINKVPADKIRFRANTLYSNKVILDKNQLAEAVTRLLLFTDAKSAKPYSTFKFDIEGNLTVFDTNNENCEIIRYQSGTEIEGEYLMRLDLSNFSKVLDTCVEPQIALHFGNGQCCVLSRGSIKNVIPEVRHN